MAHPTLCGPARLCGMLRAAISPAPTTLSGRNCPLKPDVAQQMRRQLDWFRTTRLRRRFSAATGMANRTRMTPWRAISTAKASTGRRVSAITCAVISYTQPAAGGRDWFQFRVGSVARRQDRCPEIRPIASGVEGSRTTSGKSGYQTVTRGCATSSLLRRQGHGGTLLYRSCRALPLNGVATPM